MKTFTIGIALIGVFLGLLFSPIPTRLGFYRWIASRAPMLTGFTPAFHYGVEWGYTFEELYQADLTGQTAIVTGANSGVGFETSLALARLGASVTLACRNPKKCDEAASKIQSDEAFKGTVATMTLDTSSLKSVKDFSEKFRENNSALDLLYLNAGLGSAGVEDDGSTPLSEDGIELLFATNVVGHHLLFKHLEPLVMNSKMSRIVLTSSAASFIPFKDYKVATDLETLNSIRPMRDGVKVYGQSKLAQILWANELTRKAGPGSHIYVNAMHPGAVNTAIWEKNPMIPRILMDIITYFRENVMWNSAEGALTMLYLGVATDQLVAKDLRGRYFHPQAREIVNPLALDEELQTKLWAFLDELVKDFI